jgi:hypothetical protein
MKFGENTMNKKEMQRKMLETALNHFNALESRAATNLQIYLEKSVGIGEHSDVMEELIQLIEKFTHNKDCRLNVQAFLDGDFD